MVLSLRQPHGTSLRRPARDLAVLLAYALSFVYLGIYWDNHHHLLHAVRRVTGAMLWCNLNLLFWLSLVPFARLDGQPPLRQPCPSPPTA